MRPKREEVLAWERRWSLPAAVASLLGVALVVAGFAVVRAAIGGGANYEGLEAVHGKTPSFVLAGALSTVGFALLAAPFLYLFRAAQARSERVKGELVGLVVIAPLFLAISGALLTAGTEQAATRFANGTAKPTLTSREADAQCRSQLKSKGAKAFGKEFEATRGATSLDACRTRKIEEDRASNAIEGDSLVRLAQYIGLVGGLALVVSLFYTGLWAMRTGLLTRFWGSLGMALGIAILIGLTFFALLWFFYLGLLVAGWLPRGRPPAWAAGEAIPWPTPGEKAAAGLGGGGGGDEEPPLEGEASELPPAELPSGAAPRKRKRRD